MYIIGIMKISFITTDLNEENNVNKFLSSLIKQSKLPDEIIIVDGGSTDSTLSAISNFKFPLRLRSGQTISNRKIKIKILVKKGNRSTGRNFAIRNATGDIIVCSDFGCVLDKNWIKNITKPFQNSNIDVVSGYYRPVTNNLFEKCLAPYTCVMPDKIKKKQFLPSSRSISFRKSVWSKVKYPQWLDTCEDLYFARELKRKGFKFAFIKNAIVYWPQKKNLTQAFIQFYNYAKGDGRAFYIRPQVPLVYLRYFLGFYLLLISILERSVLGIFILMVLFSAYLLWAIRKNYKYVKNKYAFLILSSIQLISDFAVLFGTTIGLISRIRKHNYKNYLKRNKFLILILLLYTGIMLATFKWGIPNKNHPFPYHMDEWHQLQAVRTTVKFGTPNIEGSANGTMFHFVTSAIYLAPFTILQIIDPVSLKIDDFTVKERVFLLLRINTIIYGVLSIISFYYLLKIVNASKKIGLLFFIFTPTWLSLSGFFKYDIALIFWILISIIFLIRFLKNPSNKNYIIAAIPSALAFSVKVSAIPLFFIYVISFFWFKHSWKQNLKYLIFGLLAYMITIFLFGIPDTIFGKGNIFHFFYENVISGPQATQNFNLGINPYQYLISRHYPVIFGHGLIMLFIFSSILWIYLFIRNGFRKSFEQFKVELFIFFSFLVFFIILMPLQIYAGGNRSLVLLPFIVLICTLTWKRIKEKLLLKITIGFIILIVITIQLFESASWIYIKLIKSPQEVSSEWIIENIPKGQTIGLENVPIYQGIPDILQKEFYYDQANLGSLNKYKYEIINADSPELPMVVVVTNDQIDKEIYYKTPKKELENRLIREGYRRFAIFYARKPYHINDRDYYLSWLISSPFNISVYKK